MFFSLRGGNILIFSSHSKSLPFHQSKKFIVFEDCLLSLFVNCHKCGQETTEVTTKIIGTFLHIEQHCSTCLNVFTWDSQPFVKNQVAGNILLSAAILFSGAWPTKVLRVLRNMGCVTIAERTFFNIRTVIFISRFQLSGRSIKQCFLGSCNGKRDN